MDKLNFNFSGNINGKAYTDIDEFVRAYKHALSELNTDTTAQAQLQTSQEAIPEEKVPLDLNKLASNMPVYGPLLQSEGLDAFPELPNDALIETYTNHTGNVKDELKYAMRDRGNLAAPLEIEEIINELDPSDLNKLAGASSRIISALTQNRSNISEQLDELTNNLEETNALLSFYKDLHRACKLNQRSNHEYRKLRYQAQKSDELMDDLLSIVSKAMGLH